MSAAFRLEVDLDQLKVRPSKASALVGPVNIHKALQRIAGVVFSRTGPGLKSASPNLTREHPGGTLPMGRGYLYACILVGLTGGAVAVGQNNGMINQPAVGSSLHGRHAWIVIGGPDKLRVLPTSTEEMKAFDQALAVQATSEQVTVYDSVVRSAETAIDDLAVFLEQAQKETSAGQFSSSAHALDQALEKARGENKQFLGSFSRPQQTGLRDLTLKVVKADSDLAQQSNLLNQRVADPILDVRQIASYAKNLDQALTNFHDQQLILGREMGIQDVMGAGDLSLNLSPVNTGINVAGQPIAVTVDGTISKIAAEGHNLFKLELAADVSDLQQKISGILASRLNKSDRCGEQVVIQGVSLTAQAPASLVVTELHLARWTCFGSLGQASPNELAEGNGTIELKLTPMVEENRTLQLAPEVNRIDADSFVGEQLRSGSLGVALRDEITRLLLSTMQTGTYFKAILPAVAQQYAVIDKIAFREAGGLHVGLSGSMQLSDEQVKIMVNQLKDRLSQGVVQQ
jgi:hypothetical protein